MDNSMNYYNMLMGHTWLHTAVQKVTVEVVIEGKFGHGFNPEWTRDATVSLPSWSVARDKPLEPIVFRLAMDVSGESLNDIFEQVRLVQSGMGTPFNVIVTTKRGDLPIVRESFIDCALSSIDRERPGTISLEMFAMRVVRVFYGTDGKVI